MLTHYKSIRNKFLVTVATTSIITCLITTILIGIFDWSEYKSRWVNDLYNQALLIGRASIPALQFDDPGLASKNLALLEVRPRIHSAALYDANRNIYATFKGEQYPQKLQGKYHQDSVEIIEDEVIVSKVIEQNGNLIGYMLLTAEYGFYNRLLAYLIILTIVGGLAFFISHLIARWLQSQITHPIEEIAELSKKVVEEKDYSLRAIKKTNDEVGYLVNAFNTMLNEIEMGNEAQQKARDELEQRVNERTEELKKSQFALLHSQKLEAVGKLTGGVAHDFNNILQVISSNLEILSIKFSNVTAAKKGIESAISAVERGAKLASQLLAFARRQPLQPFATNLNNLTKNMDDLLRRTLGEDIKIEVIQGGALWNVMVDRNQIENVILNLAINARDAMEGSGRLTIETSNVMLDDIYSTNNENIIAGQYVLLAISDTGSGMPPETIERVFEPFFTTKAEGKGTGLGLSMAYGVVKQSGGTIKIYSEVGLGTTIKIYFPRAHLAEHEITVKTHVEVKGGNESILVVEDDIAVQTAVMDILVGLGYTVQSASDAQSALDIINTGQKFDLLFTDVVMPGQLKSTELAKQAKSILPDLAVLFTSGYTQNAIVHSGKLDPGVELINKPYRHADLARKIRAVLEKTIKSSTLENKDFKQVSMAKPAVESKKIIVVEDNLEAQSSLCELLSMMNFIATGASTAEEALEQISQFDVMITDVNLPGMSGIELAKKTKSLYPHISIIISSGMELTHVFDFEIQFLSKPFSIETLTDAIEKATTKDSA